MKNRILYALPLTLALALAACGGNGPVAPGVPESIDSGTQVNVDNEFWFGDLSSDLVGNIGYVGLGFTQTGNQVSAPLATSVYSDPTDIVLIGPLTGTITGYDLAISHVDEAGDSGTLLGTFDQSEMNLTGTLTLTVDGEDLVLNVDMAYDSQLDETALNKASREFKSFSAYRDYLKELLE